MERQPEAEVPMLLENPLGEPGSKPVLYYRDLAAVIVCLGCLIATVCCVHPHFDIAWRLGSDNQLIVIGFLLSVMNQCLRQITPNLFLILEARWGKSTLQNYDAILRNSSSLSQTHAGWRAVLLLLIALPLALSVAYKRFTGGTSSADLTDAVYYYGMTGPPGFHTQSYLTGISLMFNATLPFMVASGYASNTTSPGQYPVAYGFNILVLSGNATAFLDAPVPKAVLEIQSKLATNETWNITSDVFAIVAEIDNTVDSNRNNDTFWNSYKNNTSRAIQPLYDFWEISLLSCELACMNASWSFISIYPWNGTTPLSDEEDDTSFDDSAYMFSHRRVNCTGIWTVRRDSMVLAAGSCNDGDAPEDYQEILQNNELAPSSWYMAFLAEYLGPFTTPGHENSPWKLNTLTTTVAGIFWSRIAALNGPRDDADASDFNDTTIYYPRNTKIVSTRGALRADTLLYLVLIVQPIMAIVFLLLVMLFSSVPVDRGFGLVAILAGIEKESLGLLRGAGLSGTLKGPARLKIKVNNMINGEDNIPGAEPMGEVRYAIGELGKNSVLVHGRKYG